ncbi:MAG: hypothetical protein ACREQ8_03565 [Woeseiaceae bacterium]
MSAKQLFNDLVDLLVDPATSSCVTPPWEGVLEMTSNPPFSCLSTRRVDANVSLEYGGFGFGA